MSWFGYLLFKKPSFDPGSKKVTSACRVSGLRGFLLFLATDRVACSKNSDIDILAMTAEGLWFSVLQSFAYPAGQAQMNERCQGMNDKPIKAMESCPQINCQGDKLHSGDTPNMLSVGRLQNREGSESCQYVRLFMLLAKPCEKKKQKAKQDALSASFPFLYSNLPETYPRRN